MDWAAPKENILSSCRYSNDTLIKSCYGRGNCTDFGSAGFLCNCALYYEMTSHCAENYFEIYQGRGNFYPIVMIILTVPLFFFVLLEMITDLRMTRAFRLPMFYAKISVFLFCITRLYFYAVFIKRSILGEVTDKLSSQLILAIGTVLLSVAFPLTVVTWFDILLRGKSLGESSRLAKFLKILVLSVLAVYVPLMMVLSVIGSLEIGGNIPSLLISITLLVSLLLLFSTVIILLRKVLPWLREQSNAGLNNSKFAQIQKKTNIIIVNMCLTSTLFITNVLQVAFGISVPVRFLALSFLSRMSEIIISYALFAFLENSMVRDGFLIGYFKCAEAEGSSVSKSTKKSKSSKSNKIPSTQSSTRTNTAEETKTTLHESDHSSHEIQQQVSSDDEN